MIFCGTLQLATLGRYSNCFQTTQFHQFRWTFLWGVDSYCERLRWCPWRMTIWPWNFLCQVFAGFNIKSLEVEGSFGLISDRTFYERRGRTDDFFSKIPQLNSRILTSQLYVSNLLPLKKHHSRLDDDSSVPCFFGLIFQEGSQQQRNWRDYRNSPKPMRRPIKGQVYKEFCHWGGSYAGMCRIWWPRSRRAPRRQWTFLQMNIRRICMWK